MCLDRRMRVAASPGAVHGATRGAGSGSSSSALRSLLSPLASLSEQGCASMALTDRGD